MATCPKCGYEWETRAKGEMITCPSCHRKFQRPTPVVKIVGHPLGPEATCDWCDFKYGPIYPCYVDGESAFLCPNCIGNLEAAMKQN